MRPKVGVLARVKSKFRDTDVLLGATDENMPTPRLPIGTHVFVVKTWKEDESRVRYPVVACEYGMGWLYWDELERIDEIQAG